MHHLLFFHLSLCHPLGPSLSKRGDCWVEGTTKGEIFGRRYPGRPQPRRIPYAAGLPVIRGGLVTAEFRWRISAPSFGSIEPRVASPRDPGRGTGRFGTHREATGIPCPSAGIRRVPRAPKSSVDPRSRYSGFVRPRAIPF